MLYIYLSYPFILALKFCSSCLDSFVTILFCFIS